MKKRADSNSIRIMALRRAFDNSLRLKGVPEEKLKWYRIWVRRFHRFLPEKPLPLRKQEDVRLFLDSLDSSGRLSPWQKEQASESLRILYGVVLACPWAREWPPPPVVSDGSTREGQTVSGPPSPPPSPHEEKGAGSALERVRRELRVRHYAFRTEKVYLHWVGRFFAWRRGRPAREEKAVAVRSFLEDLAIRGKVAAGTQRQALNAVAFYFHKVEGVPMGDLGDFTCARSPRHLPVVLSRPEVERLICALHPSCRLPGAFLYGSGLRLMEVLRLRVKDVDFDLSQVMVRDGKGKKDRVTVLPERYRTPLKEHLGGVRETHAATWNEASDSRPSGPDWN